MVLPGTARYCWVLRAWGGRSAGYCRVLLLRRPRGVTTPRMGSVVITTEVMTRFAHPSTSRAPHSAQKSRLARTVSAPCAAVRWLPMVLHGPRDPTEHCGTFDGRRRSRSRSQTRDPKLPPRGRPPESRPRPKPIPPCDPASKTGPGTPPPGPPDPPGARGKKRTKRENQANPNGSNKHTGLTKSVRPVTPVATKTRTVFCQSWKQKLRSVAPKGKTARILRRDGRTYFQTNENTSEVRPSLSTLIDDAIMPAPQPPWIPFLPKTAARPRAHPAPPAPARA